LVLYHKNLIIKNLLITTYSKGAFETKLVNRKSQFVNRKS